MSDSPIDWRRRLSYDQSKLQDFVDCSRRFQLRYLLQQDWPAPVAEPLSEVERADTLGKRFHLLLERHWLGLPVTVEPALAPWWEAFRAFPPPDLPGNIRRPEVHTSALINGQRMVAMFDLLAYAAQGPPVIVDWKTSQRRPTRQWLDRRLQTIVYPLLLVETSQQLVGHLLKPEDVSLIYWFANAPQQIEIFQYSTARYEADRQYLGELFDRLLSIEDEIWPLTADLQRCRLCQYRSLCDRGRVAGTLDEIFDEAAENTDSMPEVHAQAAEDEFVL